MSAPVIDAWGLYDIDAETYHADPAVKPSISSGLLAEIINGTLATAKQSHPRLGPPKTDEERKKDREKKYDLGTVAHTLALGKGRDIDVIDANDWKKGDTQKARDASFDAGRTPCLRKTFEKAEAMRDALFLQLADIPGEENTFLPEFGVSEQAGFCHVTTPLGRMWGRALFDWHARPEGRLVIRDYKTFAGQRGADPDGFFRSLVDTGKDVQGPWYSTVLAAIVGQQLGEELTWEDVDFKFIVQDPDPPYLVSVVGYEDRHWSHERMLWAIDRWAAAAGSGLYRGFIPETHLVAPPAWAKTAWEQRMLREWEGEQLLLSQGRPALALKEPDAYRVEVDA